MAQSLKNKKILIFQQRGWAFTIGHFLAKKLQDEGASLAAFTIKPTTHQFVINQKEVSYELVISSDEIKSRPEKYLSGDRYPLSEICDALGVDSIWPFVAAARNHVRSYKDKFYFGFKQNVSDEEIVNYVMALYKCIKNVFENFKPDLIISPNFVTLHHLMFNLYAKKKAVPMIALTDSKISGNYFFSESFCHDKGEFFDRLEALNSGRATSQNIEKAKKYIADFRKNFKKPEGAEYWNPGSHEKTLWQKFRHFLSPFYHIVRWYIDKPINYWESIGISIDYKPPSIILRDHFAYDRYLKFTRNYKYYPFEKLDKFVYFPLQTQPEESIDVSAPFFNNQIEVARQVAMSLPDDYTLVVKEHPTMVGMRSPSYLEKIDHTPNVKLIDYRIPSQEVLKKARLVICPVGTTIAEAAILKKPVIQLGNLGITLKLPNVSRHTDMPTLSQKIKEVLNANLETKEYEQKLENFVAAVFDIGLEINYSVMWEKGKDLERQEELWNFYKKEIYKRLIQKNV